MHPKLLACGLLRKYSLGQPKVSRLQDKQVRKLQVGKGAQRRLTDAEMQDQMAQRELAAAAPSAGGRARRITPLKISL
jgi:hypothetical protein